MSSLFNNLHSWTTSVLRGGRGLRASAVVQNQPEKLLELYEFEACPYCRKVREVLSEMDLPTSAAPAPKAPTTARL